MNKIAGGACLLVGAVLLGTLASEAKEPKQAKPTVNSDLTVIESDSITVLGCRAIDHHSDNSADEAGRRWVDFTDEGEVVWNVTAPRSGRYEAIAAYGSLAEGGRFEVSVSGQSLRGEVHETMGLYENKKKIMNLERFNLEGVIEIPQGEHAVSFRFEPSPNHSPFKLNLIELVPVAHKAAMAEGHAEARRHRASTDWFVDAKYGVMFHWTSESLPLAGKMKSYQQAVSDFDVPAFAEMVEKTGAGYVFFTAMHVDTTFPAPIKEWEEEFPGMTTDRDLIAEIADALAGRNIKLGLYLASGGMARGATRNAKDRLDEAAYSARVEKLFGAIGKRYGDRVFGYWIDNWLAVDRWYPTFDYERYFKAMKAGNPKRIVGLNSNIEASVTPWQEYWAGEANGDARARPGGRYYLRGPAKGLQRHGLIHLETGWVHSARKIKENDPRRVLIGKDNIPIEAPVYSEKRLVDFIEGFIENEGVVTINIKISQEGRISKGALELMEKLRQKIR
ncbi:MAG: alpha-L-fucosidase [Kiritimatiellales bacterium]|nr:alpha-L-fucosidase [Kiritimatiellales bacterium]